MYKKTAVLIIFIFCIVLSCGCRQHEIVYVMEATDDKPAPRIVINEDEKTFTFTYDLLSSYLNAGTYQVSDNILKATTSDGKYTYLFALQDDALQFIQEGSSAVTPIDREFSVPVQDGAIFIHMS